MGLPAVRRAVLRVARRVGHYHVVAPPEAGRGVVREGGLGEGGGQEEEGEGVGVAMGLFLAELVVEPVRTGQLGGSTVLEVVVVEVGVVLVGVGVVIALIKNAIKLLLEKARQ